MHASCEVSCLWLCQPSILILLPLTTKVTDGFADDLKHIIIKRDIRKTVVNCDGKHYSVLMAASPSNQSFARCLRLAECSVRRLRLAESSGMRLRLAED